MNTYYKIRPENQLHILAVASVFPRGQKSEFLLKYITPVMWNDLLLKLHCENGLNYFKKGLKIHYFNLACSSLHQY